MFKLTKLKNDESGIVAIVITLLLMIVLSLIVVGFSQIARNEQREALDRQLSQQARYAAESGINDIKRRILDGRIALNTNKDDCDAAAYSPDISDGNSPVELTCVLFRSQQHILQVQNSTPSKSTVLPIVFGSFTGGGKNDDLLISWQNKEGDQNIPGSTSTPFLNIPSWNSSKNISIIKIELTDASDFSNSQNLTKNTYTFYAYPRSGVPGNTIFTSANESLTSQGKIVEANCDNDFKYICRVNVKLDGSKKYFLHFTPIYSDTVLSVCPGKSGVQECDPTRTLDYAQWSIDITAKAQDVYQRLQVRMNVNPGSEGDRPEYALESSDPICKLLETWPGDTHFVNNCNGSFNSYTPSDGGVGQADFDKSCGYANCPVDGTNFSYTDEQDPRRWHYDFINKTNSPPLTNASCRWEFGSGSNLPDRTDKCQFNDFFTAEYPVKDQCITYNARLTVTFNNGTTSTTEKAITLPWNNYPQFRSPCSP